MEEISKLIRKIDSRLSSLSGILSIINSNRGILSEFGINLKQEDLDEMERIRKDLEFYKTKLEKDIIEVAFVGLEKAGKSTLINAIISKDILPSDYKRTTYTTTQIEYSPNPSVEISFYSEEEFLKEVFRKMLKDVHYPNYENQTLDTVSVRDFEEHFKSLKEKEPFYKIYESTLKNDIIEILDGKREIKELLGSSKKSVPFEEFDKHKEYITHKHKSRAVKEVKILTDVLKGLENIVIYDLPGFDSPTLIHSKFTEEKIKRADAVVFVKEAENPSIRRTEAEMIQKTKENDGVELKEKTFYFCNMVDKIPDKDDLKRIKQDFIEDLNKHEIFQSEERIIYGSALAKLQRIGENSKTDAIIGIERLGVSDGIQELLDKIRDYNQNERRKVIIRRINALIGKIEEFGENIYQAIENISTKNFPTQEYTREVIHTTDESKVKIKRELENFQYEIKNILQKKEISKKIKESISKSIKSETLLKQEDEENIKRQVEIKSSTLESRPDAFNTELRKILRKRIYDSYSSTINEEIESYFNDIKNKIIEIFLKALKIRPDKEEKFSQALENFFKQINIDFSSQKFSLDKLVERFGGDIIQLLIENPLTSKDRENKFKEIEREFYSLLAYHKDFNPNIKPSELSIIKKIIYQADLPQTSKPSYEELEKYLEDFIYKRNLSLSYTFLSPNERKEILNLLSQSSDPVSILKSAEKNKFIDDFESLRDYIQNRIDSERERTEKEGKSDKFSPKRPESYDEVKSEVKTDIENLKDFMVDCVINAINIEKMVTNQIISYINKLYETLDTIDYSNFILHNISYIRPELDEEFIKLQTKQEILKKLKNEIEGILERED